MKATELQILASPPYFESSLDPDELRILLAESEDRLKAKDKEISRLREELESDKPNYVTEAIICLLILAIPLLAIVGINSFYEGAKMDGVRQERERTAQQVEALKRTYCLDKHSAASAYQACLNSL